MKCPCEQCISLAICVNKDLSKGMRFGKCEELRKYLFTDKVDINNEQVPRADYVIRLGILHRVLKHWRWKPIDGAQEHLDKLLEKYHYHGDMHYISEEERKKEDRKFKRNLLKRLRELEREEDQ